MSKQPRWSTPERREHLLQLFLQYHNECLRGHYSCPNITHYISTGTKLTLRYAQRRTRVQGRQITLQEPCSNSYVDEWTRQNVRVDIVELIPERMLANLREIEAKNDPSRLTQETLDFLMEAGLVSRHYDEIRENVIDSWKAEDREREAYEWKLEQRQIVDGTYGKYGTTFDPVARDVYMAERPEYYLVGLGVSPFTYKRVALVRIPSTFVHLFVEVGEAVQSVSKNAQRKAKRYGKLTANLRTIDEACLAAVRDWWATR